MILKPDLATPELASTACAPSASTPPGMTCVLSGFWESPGGRLGAGLGGLADGQEITQYTYFQQSGGMDLDPSPLRSPMASNASSWCCRECGLPRSPGAR